MAAESARAAAAPRDALDAASADASAWQALDAELSRWRRCGRTPTLWWRDDDATTAAPALERLLRLSARWQVPLALAAIPARADTTLAARVHAHRDVCVLQHGYAHQDHAASDEPSAELGAHRPPAVACDELSRGAVRLAAMLGEHFVPVLVPPWNRIDGALVPALPGLGFRGLSCFAAREPREPGDALVRSNCHVDPVDWRRGGVFRGEARTLSSLTGHLRARREGAADAAEPTGLLTHHWSHDGALWAFLERLLERLGPPRVQWLDARRVFGP